MKVTLINKEEVKDFFKKFGSVAAVCYNTDEKYAKNVGKSCLKSKHMSGSRGIYFKFKFEDCPRSLIDQMVRHDVGTFKNVQSFRYVLMDDFNYYTNSLIKKYPEIESIYDDTMRVIKENYATIVDMLKEQGITGEKANQAARGILPMNTNSKFVMGFTAEALFNFMNKRLCVRAEEHIRHLAKMMKLEVLSVLPEFVEYMVADCDKNMFCSEGKFCCGKHLTKEQMQDLLSSEVVKNEITKKKRELSL